MTTLDHMWRMRWHEDMSQIARALGLEPDAIAEEDGRDAILNAIARVRRDAAREALDGFAEWAEGLTAKHPRFEQVDSMAAMMARRFKADTYPEETP